MITQEPSKTASKPSVESTVVTTSDTFVKKFHGYAENALNTKLSHNKAKLLAVAYSQTIKALLPTFSQNEHTTLSKTTPLNRVTLPLVGNLTVAYVPPRNYFDINTKALSIAESHYDITLTVSNKTLLALSTSE